MLLNLLKAEVEGLADPGSRKPTSNAQWKPFGKLNCAVKDIAHDDVCRHTHTQFTTWLPIACNQVTCSEPSVGLHAFEAPVVSGPAGDELPALLGLRSIQAHKGVIETNPVMPMLTFPGPGGYTITWEPGALQFPLSRAPSGHLVIPCDLFDKLTPSTGGTPAQQMTLHSEVLQADAQMPEALPVNPFISTSSADPIWPCSHLINEIGAPSQSVITWLPFTPVRPGRWLNTPTCH
jgi:hypothetical protein